MTTTPALTPRRGATTSGCTQLPIAKHQDSQLNWERINSPADWSLVQQAATVPLTDTAKLDSIYAQLETDFFAQQPVIPLWYNGAWFQGNTSVWSDYPASTGADQNMPVMWAGYLGAMTTVYALADLRPTRGRELTLADASD